MKKQNKNNNMIRDIYNKNIWNCDVNINKSLDNNIIGVLENILKYCNALCKNSVYNRIIGNYKKNIYSGFLNTMKIYDSENNTYVIYYEITENSIVAKKVIDDTKGF